MVLKLILPQNILDKEQYSALSTSQKGEYITNLLKQILEFNPNGVTISQIDKAINLGHSTIWHHLEWLANKAYCMKIEHGDTAVYNFNKVLNTMDNCSIQSKYYFLDFDTVENVFGKFVRVQAKQENASGNLVAHNGIMIDTLFFSRFVESLVKIKDNHLNEDKD